MEIKGFVFVLSIIVLLGSISAVAPVTQVQQFSEGFIIEYPLDNTIELGKEHLFNFHVYNISTGKQIYTGLTCYFHIYDDYGNHIYTAIDTTSEDDFDYVFNISGGNFSKVAIYDYLISCNTTSYGGYAGEYIYINKNGVETTDANSNITLISLIVLLVLSALFFIAFVFSPDEIQHQEESEEGEYNAMNISSTNNKPIKWTFFLISIMFFMITINSTFIALYNEFGDVQLGAVYDKLAMGSSFAFWMCFGLLILMWVLVSIASLVDKQRRKQAEDTGNPTRFKY